MNSTSAEQALLDDGTVATLAGRLAVAEATVRSIHPLTATRELTLTDAYAIQSVNTERRLAAGETVAGHKVGLTSLAMQQQLGVDQPDFGVIFGSMVVDSGGALAQSELIDGKVEAEVAFVLGSDLVTAGLTEEEVRAAISGVSIALEIIDSRITDWKIQLADTIADNASSARIVTGPPVPPSAELLESLLDDVITLTVDDVEVGQGPGSAVLGDPVRALHWLATTLIELGGGLRAGEAVLAGAVHAAVPLAPGTLVRATSARLGDVAVHIV